MTGCTAPNFRLRDAIVAMGMVVAAAFAPAAHAENNAPGSVVGNNPNDFADRSSVRMDYIPLRLGAFETATVRRMFVVMAGELYGTELDGIVIRRDENRIGLNNIPILGEVTRFAYTSDMFAPQFGAGSVGLIDDALVLNIGVLPGQVPWLGPILSERLSAALLQRPMIRTPRTGSISVSTIVTLNDDYSFAIAGQAIEAVDGVTERTPPPLGDIPIVGELFTTTNTDNNTHELLVLVRPSIVAD